MFCKKCGSELNEGDVFCAKCGTKIDNEFVREDYDPLKALDHGEVIEDDVIWQEAPLSEETIIIEKPKEPIESEVKEPVVEEIDDSLQVVEKHETNFKENVSQGLRAAKATISNPIKPRRRVKPATSKPSITPEEVIIPETTTEEVTFTQEFTEPEMKTTTEISEEIIQTEPVVTEEIIEETPIVTEKIQEDTPIVTETVVEENSTESVIGNDDVVDIFDDFVVDDSFGIVEEAPIVEETPIVEEAPIVEEVPTQKTIPQEITPQEALFEEEMEPVGKSVDVFEVETPVIEEPIIKETKTEPIIQSMEKTETVAPEVTEKKVVKKAVPKAVTPTSNANKSEELDLERLIAEDNDSPILSSINEARNKPIIKKKTEVNKFEKVKKIDDADEKLQSKFNTKLDDELLDESFDVDENINSLTSRITTVLIIILILIIAVVIATFLVQNIGL